MQRRGFHKIAPWGVLLLLVGFLAACVPPKVEIPSPPRAGVRFGLVTDSHYADADARGNRPYRESAAKMKECVQVMNRERVDFLIELGDFKDQDEPPAETRTLSYLRKIESIFGKFRGPRYHALGNHDHDSLSKDQALTAIENTGIPKEWSYYRFDVRGLRFLVLDANYTAKGDPYNRGAFAWADANIPPAEIDWLRSELTAAAKPVIVFIHQQLDGEGDYYVRNAATVRAILERSGKVLAVFQGHRHEGAFSRIRKIPYYTLKGMIEGTGPERNSFAVVEIDGRLDISVRGFHQAEGMTLPRNKERP